MSYSVGDKVVLKDRPGPYMFYTIYDIGGTKKATLSSNAYYLEQAHIKGLFMEVRGSYKVGSLEYVSIDTGIPGQEFLVEVDDVALFEVTPLVTEFLCAVNVYLNKYKVTKEPEVASGIYYSYIPENAFDIQLEAINA